MVFLRPHALSNGSPKGEVLQLAWLCLGLVQERHYSTGSSRDYWSPKGLGLNILWHMPAGADRRRPRGLCFQDR